MNSKKILSFVLGLMMMAILVLPTVAAAQSTVNANDLGIFYGTYTGLGTKDVRETISTIIRTAMGLLGIVAVGIILIGGFEWMTAGGNEDKTKDAKKRIMYGVIGLAIILSAYAIATFVVNSLVNATTTV
ncbi:MAG TPA: pilin [Candidatus Magasanikbacteria bacterium]|nr:pilin [Candidatus Magasanikbacteria bacterium]